MAYFRDIDLNSSERFVFSYSAPDTQSLEKVLDSTLTSIGYKAVGEGVYQKGSRFMRFMFGAMHKYYRFKIAIDPSDPNNIKVSVAKVGSGFSGGIVGVQDISKELNYLKQVFQAI